jgi:hypothetical protein
MVRKITFRGRRGAGGAGGVSGATAAGALETGALFALVVGGAEASSSALLELRAHAGASVRIATRTSSAEDARSTPASKHKKTRAAG